MASSSSRIRSVPMLFGVPLIRQEEEEVVKVVDDKIMSEAASTTRVPIVFGVPLITRQEEKEEEVRAVDDESIDEAASTTRVRIAFGVPLITRQEEEEAKEEEEVRAVDDGSETRSFHESSQPDLPHEAESSSRKRMFPCKHCDLEFDNAQALGGHQNAHRHSPTGLCLLCMKNQAPLTLSMKRSVADSNIAQAVRQVRAQKRRKLAADQSPSDADADIASSSRATERK